MPTATPASYLRVRPAASGTVCVASSQTVAKESLWRGTLSADDGIARSDAAASGSGGWTALQPPHFGSDSTIPEEWLLPLAVLCRFTAYCLGLLGSASFEACEPRASELLNSLAENGSELRLVNRCVTPAELAAVAARN
ncbi:unnamed protein product, partial [Phaeothamnion confervicola]